MLEHIVLMPLELELLGLCGFWLLLEVLLIKPFTFECSCWPSGVCFAGCKSWVFTRWWTRTIGLFICCPRWQTSHRPAGLCLKSEIFWSTSKCWCFETVKYCRRLSFSDSTFCWFGSISIVSHWVWSEWSPSLYCFFYPGLMIFCRILTRICSEAITNTFWISIPRICGYFKLGSTCIDVDVPVLQQEHIQHKYDSHLHALAVVFIHALLILYNFAYLLDIVVSCFGKTQQFLPKLGLYILNLGV